MAIRPRGNKYFVDVTYRGKRKTATCDTEPDAVLKEAELKAALMTGIESSVELSTGAKGWTLGKAYEKTVLRKWKGSKSEATAIMNADLVCDYFKKDTPVTTIDLDMIDGFIAHCENRGNSDGTINRKLAALSTMLTVASDSGALPVKPKIPRRKEAQGRIRWVSDDEESTMLDTLAAWDKTDHRDAIEVLIDTGMRLGELWRVNSTDVDFRQGLISIWVNKASHPRTIPMTARVKAILTRRLRVHGSTPFPYNNAWIRHLWDRLKGHMGLAQDTQFTPHVLRHTCASRLVQRGVSIAVVQVWLGHKTIQVTMRYAHLAPVHLLQSVHVLEPGYESRV